MGRPFDGEPGTAASEGGLIFIAERGLASLDSAALYFLAEGSPEAGVTVFWRIVELDESDEPDMAESGRFGVKGIVRGSLVGPGVCDMVEVELS